MSYITGLITYGVRTIDDGAFYNCENLTSIVIPKTVRSIGESAFMYCDDVETLICMVKNPFPIKGKGEDGATFSNYFFNNVPLYVPKGTADVYRETEGWKDFANIVEIDTSGILDFCFENNESAPIYDLNGRRLNAHRKGINVIRGKKVLMK